MPKSIAAPLIDSLVHEAFCREDDIDALVGPPEDGLTGYDRAVRLALDKVMGGEVVTHWSAASVPGSPSNPLPSDPHWAGGSSYVDRRSRASSGSPERLWRVVEGIGGATAGTPSRWRGRYGAGPTGSSAG